MNYFKIRVLFLFDTVCEYVELLNGIEDEYNRNLIVKKVNNVFNRLSKNLMDTIFKLVVVYTNKLKLNIFTNSGFIGVTNIKNICDRIVNNHNVKYISEKLLDLMKFIDEKREFNIGFYSDMLDLIEELDFICVFEMYSYLLGEESESVFSFILDSMEVIEIEDEEIYKYSNEVILDQIESKIKLFKKLYVDDEINIVTREHDHIIYEINGILKIVYI